MMLRLGLLLLTALPLAGCYVLQAAGGQLRLNASRVPVTTLLQAPSTTPELRQRLAGAARMRDYASRELALPDNRSYRAYAELGRPYVVWTVYAAPEFSVEPRTWCFPIAGCVAYRGYFDEVHAQAFARRLRARGDDVDVQGVVAYSTLGHFADPLLSSMLRWGDDEVAALMFHELAHQQVYAVGDTAFNEAFASLVEEEGLRRWLVHEGRPEALAAHDRRLRETHEFAALLADSRARLRALYSQPLAPAARRAAKAAEFDRLRAAYSAAHPGGGSYDWLLRAPLNNAVLLEVATYSDCVPALARALARVAGDLPRFYADMAAFAAGRPEQRKALCEAAAP
ncbi:MAG: aminopeptidase [Pseudomonadota bacterium]